MSNFLKLKSSLQIIIISLVALLAVSGVVMATTTIGTNVTTGGYVYASSTLLVTGATTLYNTLTVNGAATLASTLAVTGATTLSSTLTATTTVITANNAAADVLTVRQDEATGNILLLKDSAVSVLTVGPTGNVIVQPSANSTKAFSAKNAAGVPVFDIDTTNSLASTTRIIVPQASSNSPRFSASSTSVSIGDGTAITQVKFGTCTVTLGAVPASSTVITTCTASGVSTSDKVFVTPVITNPSLIFSSASSTGIDTIQIAVYNTGWVGGVPGSAVANGDDNTWSWMLIK